MGSFMDSLIQNSLLVKEGKKVSVLSSLQQMLLLFEKLWDVEIRKKMWRQFYFDFCRSKGQIRRHYGGKNLSKMSKICQKCVISGSAWTMHWCILMKTSIKHNCYKVFKPSNIYWIILTKVCWGVKETTGKYVVYLNFRTQRWRVNIIILFYQNVWRTRGNFYYFNTRDLDKICRKTNNFFYHLWMIFFTSNW